jgi:hypothetical protein
MLPSSFDNSEHQTERKIYHLLKDHTPDNWYVLHSYHLAKNSKKQKEREFDFVVLAPDLGFFVLEAKKGQIYRRDGNWYQSGRQEPLKHGGPFEQAKSGMHLLKEKVGKKFCHYTWGYGVILPDMEQFNVAGIEEIQETVFDKRNNNAIEAYIKRLAKFFGKYWNDKKHEYGNCRIPDNKDVIDVVNFLRPDYDIPLCKIINNAYQMIEALTLEQYACLDGIEENDRCLIHGLAGTGKTFLAVEEATRSCKKGMETALFCYNTQLGNWYKTQFKENCKPLFTGKLHTLMFDHIRKNGIPLLTPDGQDYFAQEAEARKAGYDYPLDLLGKDSFWENDVPQAMCKALEKAPIVFDKIIIDEYQDLLTPEYLKVFDKMLAKGISKGKWCMLGDYAQQSVHTKTGDQLTNILEQYAVNGYTRFRLTTNCRNTKTISAEIKNITGLGAEKVPEKKEMIDDPEVQFYSWKNKEDQIKKLEGIIHELLRKEQIGQKDIVILLTLGKREADKIYANDLAEITGASIKVSSIGKFKGLESKVIILTDVDTYKNRELLYQGMSRATTMLIIFESESASLERKQLQAAKGDNQ